MMILKENIFENNIASKINNVEMLVLSKLCIYNLKLSPPEVHYNHYRLYLILKYTYYPIVTADESII